MRVPVLPGPTLKKMGGCGFSCCCSVDSVFDEFCDDGATCCGSGGADTPDRRRVLFFDCAPTVERFSDVDVGDTAFNSSYDMKRATASKHATSTPTETPIGPIKKHGAFIRLQHPFRAQGRVPLLLIAAMRVITDHR